jgi:chloramphenicol 3-O phosphotransferase
MATSLIVISGGSGTGKSTLAKALQEALLPETWLHFSLDTILYCLPQSILDRANLHNDWSPIDGKRITDSTYDCARALLDAGHKIIFDCVVVSEKGAATLLDAFKDYSPVFVGLSCSWEETERRTRARGDRTLDEAQMSFRKAGKHLKHDYAFDTTGATPESMAHQLVESLRVG